MKIFIGVFLILIIVSQTTWAAKEMEKAALQFALYRGSRSGRVARQFVNDWAESV